MGYIDHREVIMDGLFFAYKKGKRTGRADLPVSKRKNSSSAAQRDKRGERARIQARLFLVYRPVSRAEHAAPVQVGFTRDISTKGVYFFTPTKPAVGEDIALTIYASASPEQELPPRLQTAGEIMRVEEIEERDFHSTLNGVAVKYQEKVMVFV
jgi:hypothetical protein